MNWTNRTTLVALLLATVLPIVATGCIVVVKEDDRDRHRYLHGSEWTLEVVFYRTQTMQAADRHVDVAFAEDGHFSGMTSCGEFSGFYETNENGGFDVSSVSVEDACGGDPMTDLLSRSLRDARTYEVDAERLRISTANEGFLSFTAE
jgi:heat shock protein HslJ